MTDDCDRLRFHAVKLAELGRLDESQETVARLLELEPNLTLSVLRGRAPIADPKAIAGRCDELRVLRPLRVHEAPVLLHVPGGEQEPKHAHGSRLPRKRAYAVASSHDTCMTGSCGSGAVPFQ